MLVRKKRLRGGRPIHFQLLLFQMLQAFIWGHMHL
jgi:hypothetical protein